MTARRPQDRQRPKPRRGVVDLDALERDGRPEPFVATVGGEEFTFHDPNDADWQTYAGFDPNDIEGSMRALLGDQYEAFAKHRKPLWWLNRLNEMVEEHYKKWYGDRGEGDASSTSSNGTTGR